MPAATMTAPMARASVARPGASGASASRSASVARGPMLHQERPSLRPALSPATARFTPLRGSLGHSSLRTRVVTRARAPGDGDVTDRDLSAKAIPGGPEVVEVDEVVGGEEATLAMPGDGDESIDGWQRRWTIVLFCFTAFLLCNMDRVNMSIAILPMSAEYGWSQATKGLVQSSFFWGYLLTQVAGGYLADKYGGKKVLGFGVVWWSAATILTPVAAAQGLPTLLAARAAMGVGEGVAMPAMNNVLSRWIPKEERSRSLSLVYSGMFVGSMTGLLLSPYLITNYGWPSVFFGFGSLGTIWFAAAQLGMTSSPQEDKRISEGERSLILGTTPPSRGQVDAIPWKKIFQTREVWAIIVCHFCHNWGTFILLTWMPTYYNQVLGMDLFESGFASVLPWATMAVSANAAGWFADTQLIGKGTSVTKTRKIMQSVGFLGPAACLSLLPHITSPPQAVALLMVSQGCDAFSHSGLYSNHQDIGPRYAGVLLGLSNTAGVLAGVLGTFAVGQILEVAGWGEVWGSAVAFYLVGTAIWLGFSTGEKVLD